MNQTNDDPPRKKDECPEQTNYENEMKYGNETRNNETNFTGLPRYQQATAIAPYSTLRCGLRT